MRYLLCYGEPAAPGVVEAIEGTADELKRFMDEHNQPEVRAVFQRFLDLNPHPGDWASAWYWIVVCLRRDA